MENNSQDDVANFNKVTIHFGPYETNGTVKHKRQRLHGLLDALTQLHYDVELIPKRHLNALKIFLCGMQIYSCKVTTLGFNMHCSDDPVCKKIVTFIEEIRLDMRLGLRNSPFGSRDARRHSSIFKNPDCSDYFLFDKLALGNDQNKVPNI